MQLFSPCPLWGPRWMQYLFELHFLSQERGPGEGVQAGGAQGRRGRELTPHSLVFCAPFFYRHCFFILGGRLIFMTFYLLLWYICVCSCTFELPSTLRILGMKRRLSSLATSPSYLLSHLAEVESPFTAQAGLDLVAILLPQPHSCWSDRYDLPYSAGCVLLS